MKRIASTIVASATIGLIVAQAAAAAADRAIRSIDFAESSHVDDWLRHPVFGDPSFDAFERLPGNPILRGAAPLAWPVNGSFFLDPASGNWYLYVGEYVAGYFGGPSRCEVFRSEDKGKHWRNLGKIFPDAPLLFESDGKSPGHLPDVSVVYFDHRYHMVYDWGKADQSDGGIAYALSDRPEGPFHRDPEPIQRQSRQEKLLNKYNRPYAATLLRRQKDWLVLGMMDAPPFGWAMYATTATDPHGPWSKATIVRHPEANAFHPPLMEFFPAFATSEPPSPPGGRTTAVREPQIYAYAPATSVARNRNFQCLFRASLEHAEDPAAWELVRHGSLWHSEDVEHESFGIWGQTFSGSVDPADGAFRVLFPARDSAGNGTINVAVRDWARPFRPHGFVLSGHQGRSATFLLKTADALRVRTTFRLRGSARLMWDYRAPLEPNTPTSDATLADAMLTRHQGLDLPATGGWRVIAIDGSGKQTVLAGGERIVEPASSIAFERSADGSTRLSLDDRPIWHEDAKAEREKGNAPGAIGWLIEPQSHLFVSTFEVTPSAAAGLEPATLWYGGNEALLDAAEDPGRWQTVQSERFHFGHGLISRAAEPFAKWSVIGHHLALWSPRGPGYGTLLITLDGTPAAPIDLHADHDIPSAPVWRAKELSGDFHAVVLHAKVAPIPVDCLEVK